MNPLAASESCFHFDRIGPIFKIIRRKGNVEKKPSTAKRIILLTTLAWLPLLLFSILQGQALGPTPRQSLVLDLSTYARFFVAVPILVAAERFIASSVRKAQSYFVDSELVRCEDMPAYKAAIARARRRTESIPAEVILIVIAFLLAWFAQSLLYENRVNTWRYVMVGSESHLSLAGWWSYLISTPILQFLFLRWLWRLIIWGGFLGAVSKLNLRLVATHPDRAGGLGILGLRQVPFAIITMAIGSIISGDAAFRIIFEGVKIESLELPFIAYLIIFDVIFILPLLLFLPALMRTRREGLRTYGMLASRYNLSFHEKWVEAKTQTNERLLGTSDIQSLADLGNSFRAIQQMRPVPFSILNILQMAIIATVPLLPLLPFVVPIASIARFLVRVVL